MFFKQLSQYCQGMTVNISANMKDGTMILSVKSGSMPGVKDGDKIELAPIIVTGTPEEMDEDFFNVLRAPLEKAKGIFINTEKFDESVEEEKDNETPMEKKARLKKEKEKSAKKSETKVEEKRAEKKVEKQDYEIQLDKIFEEVEPLQEDSVTAAIQKALKLQSIHPKATIIATKLAELRKMKQKILMGGDESEEIVVPATKKSKPVAVAPKPVAEELAVEEEELATDEEPDESNDVEPVNTDF
jgi:PRTRC genetic system protein E